MNIFADLTPLIDAATTPILFLVVSEGCERTEPLVQTQLQEELRAKNYNVVYRSVCVAESDMPFPRLATPTLYFFIPRNHTPIMYRQFVFTPTLNDDVVAAFKMMQGATYEQARFNADQLQQITEMEQILAQEQQVIHTYPSTFQMARNLAKEIWKSGKQAARGLPLLVDTETGFKRLSTCESCDKYDADKSRCTECGCFMKTKTQLASASCPLNKW